MAFCLPLESVKFTVVLLAKHFLNRLECRSPVGL